ncbi:MAG TPA: dTMP kinase [Noviherbaspirillum sp.]|uniref:dTMP kinase n=1 Tax=Noviherbaspirillum sp. TaxID=1926288 RepID=UPI002B4A3C56|nr:dTMP kinase [Noviherbaspirillum sp.]HJV86385.1 dTMP kinase [Noviherbaspirillum sp.]
MASVPRPPRRPVNHDNDVRSVLRVGPFRRLWLALAVSSLGDWIGLLATTALATSLQKGYSAKAYALGSVLVVRLLPALLLGPVAGAVADRLDRRLTMVVADVVRFGLFVSIPVVGTLWWLLVASFLVECASLFWNPAKDASVPNLLRPEQLEAGNTLSLITTYGTAPVAAGIFALLSALNRALASGIPFFSTNPVDLALYFDAATFLASACAVFTLRSIGRARRAEAAPQLSFWASITEGWRFVGGTRLVRGLVVGILGGFAGVGCVVALGRLYAGLLRGGDAAYGVLFGSAFVGLAGGMALGPRLLGGYSRRRLFGIAVTGAGVTLMIVAVLPNLVVAVGMVVLIGAFAGVAWVTGYTLLQAEVSDDKRGRTFALVQSLVRVDLLLVLAAAPTLVGLIGAHSIVLPNGARIRADGVTLVLLAGGVVAVAVGLYAFRQMDDQVGVPVLPEIWAAVRGRPLPPRHPGFFLVVEGGEGAGKSTQVALLRDWLAGLGREVVVTREPGGTPLGEKLRALLLDPAGGRIGGRAEALLYAADRAEHVERVVEPALRRGAVVLSDRYVDSSLAYQGAGRELDHDMIGKLSQWATGGLVPDLTVLLDLPAEEGLRRARGQAEGSDRMEAETVAFHERVREGFLRLARADPQRYLRVDAGQPAEEVQRRIRAALPDALPVPVAQERADRVVV